MISSIYTGYQTPLTYTFVSPTIEDNIKSTSIESKMLNVPDEELKEETTLNIQKQTESVGLSGVFEQPRKISHSKIYRMDMIGKILVNVSINLDRLKIDINSPAAFVDVGLINKDLAKSWSILTEEDHNVKMTISLIQSVLKNNLWGLKTKEQVQTLQKIVDNLITQEDTDFYQFALTTFNIAGVDVLPVLSS